MRNIVFTLVVTSALTLAACQKPAVAEKAEDTAAAHALAQAKAYDSQIKDMPAPITKEADKNAGTKGGEAAPASRTVAGAP